MRSSSTPVSPPPPPPVTTRVATLPPLASPERRRRRGSRVRSNVPRVSPSAATTALRRVHRVPHAASGAASAAVDEEEPQKPRRDPRWDRSALDDAALLAALLTAATLLITRVPMTPVSVAISALHPPGASCVRSSRHKAGFLKSPREVLGVSISRYFGTLPGCPPAGCHVSLLLSRRY